MWSTSRYVYSNRLTFVYTCFDGCHLFVCSLVNRQSSVYFSYSPSTCSQQHTPLPLYNISKYLYSIILTCMVMCIVTYNAIDICAFNRHQCFIFRMTSIWLVNVFRQSLSPCTSKWFYCWQAPFAWCSLRVFFQPCYFLCSFHAPYIISHVCQYNCSSSLS